MLETKFILRAKYVPALTRKASDLYEIFFFLEEKLIKNTAKVSFWHQIIKTKGS